jgi:glutathione S-transferase
MLCEQIADLFKEAKKSFNETTKNKSNDNELTLINTMKLFEDRLNQTSSNGFLIGSKLTWADLFLANIFDIINRKSQINLDNFPTIKKHRDAIKRLPNVIKYYNNNSD